MKPGPYTVAKMATAVSLRQRMVEHAESIGARSLEVSVEAEKAILTAAGLWLAEVDKRERRTREHRRRVAGGGA